MLILQFIPRVQPALEPPIVQGRISVQKGCHLSRRWFHNIVVIFRFVRALRLILLMFLKLQGNVEDFSRMAGLADKGVLYFGDHIVADLTVCDQS